MSIYTTEVRFICETYAGYKESQGYDKVNEIVANAQSKIFELYPIFDESYRSVLNTKILRHYYTREICAETVGLWKLWLNNKMNEIMPYYNKLYNSELLKFNPLYDVDLSTLRTRDEKTGEESTGKSRGTDSRSGSNNRETESLNTGDTITKRLDTPQGGLNGLINDDYMTAGQTDNVNNVYKGKEKGGASSSGTNNLDTEGTRRIGTLESYIEHVSGKNGGENYSKKLIDFRKTFLNIDEEIIKQLRGLFFGLWD